MVAKIIIMVTFRWLTVFGIGCSQFRPISKSIPVGMRLDRYRLDTGNFLAPAGTPYEQRSLKPDTNRDEHTVYEVIKALPVVSGQTAAWFGQPGGGVQYFTKGIGNVAYLLDQKYLKEVKL